MFNKIKAKCAVAALVAIVLTFLSQGTLSYYSVIGTATNVVTSGDIRFIIHEKTDQGTDFPAEGVYIVPGDIVSKQVTIESDCDHPFYLRVKVVYGVDSKELTSDECFKLNINEQNWKLHDGWYYYTGILQPGEDTPALFTQVEIVGSKVDQSHIGSMLSLTVRAYAVQSENNPAEHPWDAAGWPAD